MTFNWRNIGDFVLGGIVAGVIGVSAIFTIVIIAVYDYSGELAFKNPRLLEFRFFLVCALVLILLLLIYFCTKKIRSFSRVVVLVSSFWLAATFFYGVRIANDSTYYEPFEKKKWDTTDDRSNMARWLVRNNSLIGLSYNQVLNQLGPDHDGLSDELYYHLLGGVLSIYFQNGKVINCYLSPYD